MAIQATFLEQRPNGGGGQYKLVLQQPLNAEKMQEVYTQGCLTGDQYNLLAALFDGVSPSWLSFDSVYSKTLTHAQANALWKAWPQIQNNLGKCATSGVLKVEPDYSVMDYIEATGTPQLDQQQIQAADADIRKGLGLPSFSWTDFSQITTAIAVLAAVVGLVVVVVVLK